MAIFSYNLRITVSGANDNELNVVRDLHPEEIEAAKKWWPEVEERNLRCDKPHFSFPEIAVYYSAFGWVYAILVPDRYDAVWNVQIDGSPVVCPQQTNVPQIVRMAVGMS